MKTEKGNLITFRVDDCPTHGVHVSDVRVSEIDYYEAEGPAGSSATVGWTPRYDANWEATFGEKKPEPELN